MIRKIVQAKGLLWALRCYKIEACVAGGYARDLLLGRTPKDMDVLILSEIDADTMISVMRLMGLEPTFCSGEASETATDRLDWVVQAEGIDFIKYIDAPKFPEEHVELFDCTLNHVWIDNGAETQIHTGPLFTGLGRVQYVVEDLIDNCEDRLKYLMQKFPEKEFVVVTNINEAEERVCGDR